MIGVIIQARTGSSRFPRKIYEDLNGKSTLYRVLESATSNDMPHKIILAMPEYDREEFMTMLGDNKFKGAIDDRFCTFFGSPDNLVERYCGAAKMHEVDLVVRLTADCPFGGTMIDEMLIEYLKNGYSGFMGNNDLVSQHPYPDGCDVEIFPYWMLVETVQLTRDPVHLEHVTPFMYRRGTEYKIYPFLNQRPNSIITMKHKDFSFDTEEDRVLLLEICKEFDKVSLVNLPAVSKLNIALEKVEQGCKKDEQWI